MAWTISKSLAADYAKSHSSPEPVAASSAGTCSAGEQSVQSSETPTQRTSSRRGKTTGTSRRSRSGTMSAHSTAFPGEDVVTWFLGAFPVRTSAPQAAEQASTGSDQDSGERWRESFAKWNRDTHSWRTSQRCVLGGWVEFSETWPKWGTMRDGACWAQSMPVRRRGEIASGFWPTPTVSGNYNRAGSSPKAGNGLATEVRMYASPKARDWKGQSQRGIHAPGDALPNMDRGDGDPIGSAMNPTWVEWLMGWPIGWTDCEPLATDRFRQWQHSHGVSSEDQAEA